MKFNHIILFLFTCLLFSCNSNEQSTTKEIATPEIKNKGHELIHSAIGKTGSYASLASKKDVTYTYTYETPDGQKDVSTEKYIFDGELSYAKYEVHQRTLSQLEGTIEQGYNGKEFWLKHNGAYLQDEESMKQVIFNRKTNFYWFCMFQKLLDPGLSYQFIKEVSIDNNKYDIVKITFDSTDGKPTDTYQLYINQKTKLVDQFLFTVVDFNVVENPMLMQMEYEEIDGLFIPTKRQYKKSTWDAEVSDAPWIKVNWTDIKFNNGFVRSDFDKL